MSFSMRSANSSPLVPEGPALKQKTRNRHVYTMMKNACYENHQPPALLRRKEKKRKLLQRATAGLLLPCPFGNIFKSSQRSKTSFSSDDRKIRHK